MATGFEWIKLILDRWAIIVPILLFLGSSVGWSFSAVDNTEKDELTTAMKEQITVLANTYIKPKQPKKVKCAPCDMRKHIQELH